MELILEKDDVMFLYSDGVTEAENNKKEQFGISNLCDTLKKYHDLTAEKIKDKFMKDLYNFMGETEIYDDISVVVIKQR
jgi:sigma-B regulation protein RsbU (phosphoserine phosphatase)